MDRETNLGDKKDKVSIYKRRNNTREIKNSKNIEKQLSPFYEMINIPDNIIYIY